MGHKSVCFKCKKSFSLETFVKQIELKCPECGELSVKFNHKFRPPKKVDLKAWEVVEFLYNNGFIFQHIYKDNKYINDKESYRNNYENYPNNMNDAIEFIKKYKSQAHKIKK